MTNLTQPQEIQKQMSYIAQAIGDFLVKVRIATEKGLTDRRVKAKDELVARLDSRTSGELADEIKRLVAIYDWSNERNLDKFTRLYHKLEQKYGMTLTEGT